MPNARRPVRYRTEYVRSRNRITAAQVVGVVTVVVVLAVLFVALLNL